MRYGNLVTLCGKNKSCNPGAQIEQLRACSVQYDVGFVMKQQMDGIFKQYLLSGHVSIQVSTTDQFGTFPAHLEAQQTAEISSHFWWLARPES